MMGQHSHMRSGEPKESVQFRTNEYPISYPENEILLDDLVNMPQLFNIRLSVVLGEVTITQLTAETAARVRRLLENKRVVHGKYTLREV